MKRALLPTLVALGIVFAGQASAAVETYTVDLNGYAVIGFVGSTPEDFAQAQRDARNWEIQRELDLKPQTMKAVAIDESQNTAMTDSQLANAIVAAALAKRP
jgi:hypothetical protein